ncbi:aspartic proteinase CDR1-like [Nymphaea colorata]|nr:aspartic proteinase CDR1-like [Nymphaea colorata]
MKLSLATPSHLYWATLVTVSDLIWTMCHPCDSCSGQTSMFDPLQSSTYKSQTCSASSCMELPIHGCTINQLCGFIYSYEDNSFVEVILASETLLFDNGAGTIKLPEIVSGCVHQDGPPNPSLLEVPDLVGLGGGPLSLVNQIGSSIDDKFAYCLPPNSNEITSDSSNPVRTQSFQARKGFKKCQWHQVVLTYHVLNLIDISIGNNRLKIQFGVRPTNTLRGLRVCSGYCCFRLEKMAAPSSFSKICFNPKCGTSSSERWWKGWRLRSGNKNVFEKEAGGNFKLPAQNKIDIGNSEINVRSPLGALVQDNIGGLLDTKHTYFPAISHPEGLPLRIRDANGNDWFLSECLPEHDLGHPGKKKDWD